MKLLFAMFQGGGNIPLIAPIAGELVRRGHIVRVLAGPGVRRNRIPLGPAFVQRMVDAGCEVVPLPVPETHPFDSEDAPRRLTRKWVSQAFVREAREAHTTLWSSFWANEILAEIDRSVPDAVVSDYMLLGALAAAEARGVPSVALAHTVPPPMARSPMPPQSQGFLPAANPAEELRYRKWRQLIRRTWIREGLGPHNRTRERLGLGLLPEPRAQLNACERVLMLASRNFDFPGALPSNVRYVGTPIDDLDAVGTWKPPWPAEDERPLLLISLSTLAQGQAPVLQRCVQAASDLPFRVLVTLGPAMKREELGSSENIVFESFVPHSAVLPHVSAVVTQCGLGTLVKTLRQGLPVVCVPLLGDQPDNAARVEAKGVGIRLSPDAPVSEIRAGILEVVNDGGYRTRAQELSHLIAEDGARLAADEIEAVASRET